MSLEQAKKFIAKMKDDKVFCGRIMDIEDPEEQFQAILDAGFDFTREELEEVRLESELDNVSGGQCGGTKCACMMFLCLITTVYKPK